MPKLIMKRERGVLYSVSSWDGKFYNHTNKDAEDFKIDITDNLEKLDWKPFILPKKEVLIGSLTFLKSWIIRSETSNALDKLFVRNISTNIEEELIFSDEKIYVPGVSLTQRVLLIDDLSDTGLTLNKSIEWLKKYPQTKDFNEEVKTACLWKKKSSTFEPDFCPVRLESDPWIVQPTEHYEELTISEIIKRN